MILRGVFLASVAEVQWYLSGMRRFLPDAWLEFAGDAGDSIVAHYRTLVDHPDRAIALAAARRWSDYESRVMAPGDAFAKGEAVAAEELLAHTRVQLHYLENQCFLMPDELLDNLPRIGARPTIIVQGRLDMVCPPATAFEVARCLPHADLRLIPEGGHSALQPVIARALCAATADMRESLS
jgi:proline iminopeptidase